MGIKFYIYFIIISFIAGRTNKTTFLKNIFIRMANDVEAKLEEAKGTFYEISYTS